MISTVLPTENITTVSSDNKTEEVKTEKIITPNLTNVVSFPEFFQKCRNNNKNDVNLNILNSELVTFRTNFYRHIPRKNFKTNIMSNSTNNATTSITTTTTSTAAVATTTSTTDGLTNNYLLSQMKNNIGFSTTITSSTSTIPTSSLSTTATQKPKHSEVLRGRDSYVWDMWTPNTTPASTVLNSPDLTEIEIKNQYHHHHHHHHNQHHNQQHQIKVGRSPVNDSHNSCSPTSPLSSSNLAVVADGEIVVFDDIEDNWHRNNIISSPVLSEDEQQQQHHHYKFQEEFDNYRYGHNYSDIKDNEQASGNTKITKMIGALPIAEYNESPRRFGNIHHHDTTTPQQHKYQTSRNLLTSPSYYSPRPGFPKRVILSPSDNSIIIDKSDSYDEACRQNDTVDLTSATTSLQTTTTPLSHPVTTTTGIDNKEQTFDYLYEFSETRKVLEEFFKCPNEDDKKLGDFNESDIGNYDMDNIQEHLYIGQRLAKVPNVNNDDDNEYNNTLESPRPTGHYNIIQGDLYDNNEIELYLDSGSRSSGELADTEMEHNTRRHSRNFTLSPETTDYDSNCGDLDSLSNDVNGVVPDFVRLYTSMPVLEDGLSSGHASDTENNNPISIVIDRNMKIITNNKLIDNMDSPLKQPQLQQQQQQQQSTSSSSTIIVPGMAQRNTEQIITTTNNMLNEQLLIKNKVENSFSDLEQSKDINKLIKTNDMDESLFTRDLQDITTAQPPTALHRTNNVLHNETPSSSITALATSTIITTSTSATTPITTTNDVQAALIDIRNTLQRTKTLPINQHDKINLTEVIESNTTSPIWIPRREDSHESLDSDNPSKIISIDDEEADTDLETDRLLGQQRLDDQGFYDEKNWLDRKIRTTIKSPSTSKSPQTIINNFPSAAIRQVISNNMMPSSPTDIAICNISSTTDIIDDKNCIQPNCIPKSPTDSIKSKKDNEKKGKTRNKEGRLHDPAVLIEGVLFRARYLGSTQLVCEGQPTKTTRMMQAEEAVSRIKAPEGETQPSTEVDLFISTEKIMVLNTDLKEIMMDHALRTISYIADIGDLVVLMARRRFVPQENDEAPKPNRTPKMICHVFESEEAQFIAQSIGQAFQVAYMEFLKANGIEDHSFVKEMDYQEVLNSQEIFGDELEIFAKKELQKEVVVPKAKGEILGVVIVESGWGSMLPTVVIANLLSSGAAARCGQLNIGDQIIAINGLSLVGLPLSTCQNYIRNTKNQTAVKFTVVPCPPVVEVKIKRPNTKYQLGFSVQNGVICSLLRGGIAERGGVRVGHRIIEINNQSVVAVPHEKIVNLLATSVGEILMKTMPTSMFRLLTGQENPVYI